MLGEARRNDERRTTALQAVEVTPMFSSGHVVEAVPVEASAEAENVPVVHGVVVTPVSLRRSLSSMRLAVRTTGIREGRGLPYCTCLCESHFNERLQAMAALVIGTLGYLLASIVIVVAAGGIARLLAATDQNDASLGGLAFLSCLTLFTCFGVSWSIFVVDKRNVHDSKSGGMCCLFWIGLGIIASVLCTVLAHIGNRIHYLESAAPTVVGIDPRLAEVPLGYDNFLKQDEVREISFMSGAFLDIGLGVAYVDDVMRTRCDKASCHKGLKVLNIRSVIWFLPCHLPAWILTTVATVVLGCCTQWRRQGLLHHNGREALHGTSGGAVWRGRICAGSILPKSSRLLSRSWHERATVSTTDPHRGSSRSRPRLRSEFS